MDKGYTEYVLVGSLCQAPKVVGELCMTVSSLHGGSRACMEIMESIASGLGDGVVESCFNQFNSVNAYTLKTEQWRKFVIHCTASPSNPAPFGVTRQINNQALSLRTALRRNHLVLKPPYSGIS